MSGSFECSSAERHKPPFLLQHQLLRVQHDMCENRLQACPFPAGVVSLVSGEVKHFVHLIRWNSYSRFMPIGARIDHGPGMA